MLKIQRTAAHTQDNYLVPKANGAELRNPGLGIATTGCLSAAEEPKRTAQRHVMVL